MSRVIIICGLPGSGKTTLASELSKELRIFCLHKDSIKESLFDSLKYSTLEESKRIGYPSVKVMLDLAEENIRNGIDVILESPFNFPEEGMLFQAWKKKYEVNIYSIIAKIDAEERKRRFIDRERHRAHRDTERLQRSEQTFSDVCSYEHMPEKKLFLDTTQPVEKLVGQVIEFLNK